MDTLTFISHIVGSLAWPAVVMFLLIFLRDQLKVLAMRLLNLKLPGGVEVSFKEILEETREVADEIREEAQPKLIPPRPEDDALLALATTDPSRAVLDSYGLIERVIVENDKLPHRKSTLNYMRLFKHKGLVDFDSYVLFDKLRQVRNAIVHGNATITADEAAEYVEQARFLRNLLAEQFAKQK